MRKAISLANKSFDTACEMCHVEVEEQSYPDAAQLQIRQKLGDVNREHFLYGFHFDQDNSLHSYVDSVCRIDLEVVIDDREGQFGLDKQAGLLEIMNKTSMVGTFQQSRPKGSLGVLSGRGLI